MKDTGKGAIVVPTGFITAKSGIAFKIRKHLVDNKILKGVVSMPSNVFANTGTNVSVVFIDKNKTEKPVFIDASKLGETIKIGKNQKTNLRSDEIAQIVDTFRNEKVVEQFSVTPSYEEVAEKGIAFLPDSISTLRLNMLILQKRSSRGVWQTTKKHSPSSLPKAIGLKMR